MKLSTYQYDLLKTRFNQKRISARYELDKRTEEVYLKIPRIKEINDSIASESVKAGKSALTGDCSLLSGLKERISILSREREKLLKENGFPEDYLTEHFECQKCKDTGFIGNEPCTCFKAAITDLIFKETNLNEIIQRENFSTFDTSLYSDDPKDRDNILGLTPYENILAVIERTKQFIANFDNDHLSLFVYGNTGLGKTFLVNCIAYEILKSNHTVLYFTTFALLDAVSKSKIQDPDTKDKRFNPESLMTCDLLIIDDLGTEYSNSYTDSILYSVINERMISKRSTVISTNLSPQKLNEKYGERLFSRIMNKKDYMLIKLIGTDIRVRLKK